MKQNGSLPEWLAAWRFGPYARNATVEACACQPACLPAQCCSFAGIICSPLAGLAPGI